MLKEKYSLWNEISDKMEIKTVNNREYYKFKGKEKDAIDSIKKFSGVEALKELEMFMLVEKQLQEK